MVEVKLQGSVSGRWCQQADREHGWQWMPYTIPAPSTSAEQPDPSAQQPGPSAEQPGPSAEQPRPSMPVEVEEEESDHMEAVAEEVGDKMETVIRLLRELKIAVGEVGAHSRLAAAAPKHPSPAVEGMAEGKRAVQNAAEAGAVPPLPEASVLPADNRAGRAAASDGAVTAHLTVPRQAMGETDVTMPMQVSIGSSPGQLLLQGCDLTRLPPQQPPAATRSPDVYVLSPRGLTPAAPKPPPPPPLLPPPPRPCGLSIADVPRHSGGDYYSLHKQARAALNNLYATRLQDTVVPAFAWREYVCAHPASHDLVGTGIQSFVAEPIAGTRDANRRGHPRIDFVVQRVDGWAARIHPGRKPREDAAVCWFPPGAFTQGGQSSGVGADMYVAISAQPAPAGGPPVLLTVEEAARVPPADRMGKAAAYQRIIWLRDWIGPNEEHGLIDITHCTEFAWQTWLANVRDHQAAFIGPGICSIFIMPSEQPEVQLWAHRCDGTWACLQLDRNGSMR